MKKLLATLVVMSSYAYADLPLTVEDLTTDKNRFKLDTSLSYYNQNQTSLAPQTYGVADLGNGRVIILPAPATENNSNTDMLIIGTGLRLWYQWFLGDGRARQFCAYSRALHHRSKT